MLEKTHLTGAVSELIAAQYFLKVGCQVYFPTVQQGKVDFVVEYPDGQLKRVQVKTAVVNRGKDFNYEYLQCRTRSTNKKSNEPKDFTYDLFVPVYGKNLWLIPSEVIKTSNLCLGSNNPKYKESVWTQYKKEVL